MSYAVPSLKPIKDALESAETNFQNQIDALPVPIGEGQTWQDVTSIRATETIFQNTTGRSIAVYIEAEGHRSFEFSEDVTNWVRWPLTNAYDPLSVIVPSGFYYRFVDGPSIIKWLELR